MNHDRLLLEAEAERVVHDRLMEQWGSDPVLQVSVPYRRMITDVIDVLQHAPRMCWRPLVRDEHSCLMTVEDFVNGVRHHAFTNDDGTGYYATVEREMVGCYAVPSEIFKGAPAPEWATHVSWYNK